MDYCERDRLEAAADVHPYTQAQKFDKDAKYIRYWGPELESADVEAIISGKLGGLERVDYLDAIVANTEQQHEFKTLYASVKK